MFIIDGVYFDTEYRSLALAVKECVDKSLKVLVSFTRDSIDTTFRGYIIVPHLVPVLSFYPSYINDDIIPFELSVVSRIQHSNKNIGGKIWDVEDEIAFKRLGSIQRLKEIQETLTQEKSDHVHRND